VTFYSLRESSFTDGEDEKSGAEALACFYVGMLVMQPHIAGELCALSVSLFMYSALCLLHHSWKIEEQVPRCAASSQ
jgi:hypothetical protein